MRKKVCISGYYGFDNFGDEMILKILIENLKNFKEPPEITVFSVNPDKTARALNVKSVNTFKIKEIIPSLKNCDCLISGGGSLLQDSSSALSLLYYLFVVASAVLFKKKVLIFAQGIGPVHNIFFRKLMLEVLKRADYITVRDNNSFKLLKKAGINKIELCPDPVFNIEIPKQNSRCSIGVQLREAPILTDNFINELAVNINKYYSDKQIFILSLQNKYDAEICGKFKAVLKKLNSEIEAEIILNTSNDEVIKTAAGLEALIAMRYHACLIGIKAGIKVLAVNYDIKVKTLAEEFNLININSADDIKKAFETFVNQEFRYDEDKINSKKFDFKKLENLLSI